MKKALAIAGILALSTTPPVWSKGDNALPPSQVWEEEMMLIAIDPFKASEEETKRELEEEKRVHEEMRRENEKMMKEMERMFGR